jgi:hypothetical protein
VTMETAVGEQHRSLGAICCLRPEICGEILTRFCDIITLTSPCKKGAQA